MIFKITNFGFNFNIEIPGPTTLKQGRKLYTNKLKKRHENVLLIKVQQRDKHGLSPLKL